MPKFPVRGGVDTRRRQGLRGLGQVGLAALLLTAAIPASLFGLILLGAGIGLAILWTSTGVWPGAAGLLRWLAFYVAEGALLLFIAMRLLGIARRLAR